MFKTKRMSKYLFVLFIIGIAADFFSKYLAKELLSPMDWFHPAYPYGGLGLFKDWYGISLSLNYVENRGTAWGLFSRYFDGLLVGRSILVLFLIIYLFFINQDKQKQIPLVLVITGALGNILDGFIYGHVIDMIHFVFWGYSFPVFNIADVCICLGAGWLMILSFIQKKSSSVPTSFIPPKKFDFPGSPPKGFK